MSAIVRYAALTLKLLLFLVVLGVALKNTQSVEFHAYLGYVWQAPLIVMLGAAFVLGAALGILAMLPRLVSLRRQNAIHADTHGAAGKTSGAAG